LKTWESSYLCFANIVILEIWLFVERIIQSWKIIYITLCREEFIYLFILFYFTFFLEHAVSVVCQNETYCSNLLWERKEFSA
jgi:hypothetical protein